MIMKDIKNKIHELIESAYRMGYEDGKNLKYDLGLNDAWECARKVYSLSADEIINIFGGCSTWVNYSASEAMAKIKEYEEKQKRDYEEPKMGQWVLLDECANSGYYCSECHKKLVKEGWSDTVKKIKYCPNCGCAMKGDKE